MQTSQLSRLIKQQAHQQGFSLAGITTPDSPDHFSVFEDWLAQERHGEMRYLETGRARLRRSDPRQILPECRSILILGIRYPSPGREQNAFSVQEARPVGKVASYAWNEDYHDVLPERLKAILAFIEAQVGQTVPNRWYTDTGPILERDLAQRAGLGWIGKNTCLIHPEKGSYFLLAEILLGIDLEPDTPFLADRCGSCTRCLEACPTSCILSDRTLDARRCISYLTIELRGAIPVQLRSQMQDWVFGCDVCQQVCPWNLRFASPQREAAFAPRPGVPAPDLIHELSLSPQEFNRKFKGSPVKRAKRRGYLRNVAVALGNAGDAQAVPALVLALKDVESLVRGHAAWALGRIGGPVARKTLEQAYHSESDADVREEIRAALDGFK
jgi:epoxyqueuosine reductase